MSESYLQDKLSGYKRYLKVLHHKHELPSRRLLMNIQTSRVLTRADPGLLVAEVLDMNE